MKARVRGEHTFPGGSRFLPCGAAFRPRPCHGPSAQPLPPPYPLPTSQPHACATKRERQLVVVCAKNIFKEVDRTVLPGNVPATAWRRLLLQIKEALSLRDLLRLFSIYSKNTRVWQSRHNAAMLARAASLTYYKSLSSIPSNPTPTPTPNVNPATTTTIPTSSTQPGLSLPSGTGSSQSNNVSTYVSSSSSSGVAVAQQNGVPPAPFVPYSGGGVQDTQGHTSPTQSQLHQLLAGLAQSRTLEEGVRRVDGFRLAQLLVACSNLRVDVPPMLLALVVRELLREDSKKLRRCGSQLLAELIAALPQSLPLHSHSHSNSNMLPNAPSIPIPTSPPTAAAALHAPSQPSPTHATFNATPQLHHHHQQQQQQQQHSLMGPPSFEPSASETQPPTFDDAEADDTDTTSPHVLQSPTASPSVPLPTHTPVNPMEQPPPPPPDVVWLAVKRHARTRPSLRGPEQDMSIAGQQMPFSKKARVDTSVDVVHLWNELHRAAHLRLLARTVPPNQIVRMAWGFAQAGYHSPALFSALEDALLPPDPHTPTTTISIPAQTNTPSLNQGAPLLSKDGGSSNSGSSIISRSSSSPISVGADSPLPTSSDSNSSISNSSSSGSSSAGAWIREVAGWKTLSDFTIPRTTTTLPQSPQALSTLACALAIAGHASPRLMSAIGEQFLKAAVDARPSHVAQLCWACASLGHKDVSLQDQLAEHVVNANYRMGTPELCTIAWAYSQWGALSQDTPLLAYIIRQLLRPASNPTSTNISSPTSKNTTTNSSSSSSSSSSSRGSATQPSLGQGAKRETKNAHDATQRPPLLSCASNAELASLAHSLAGLMPPRLLRALEQVVVARLESLSAQEKAAVLWALARGGRRRSAAARRAAQIASKQIAEGPPLPARSRAELVIALKALGSEQQAKAALQQPRQGALELALQEGQREVAEQSSQGEEADESMDGMEAEETLVVEDTEDEEAEAEEGAWAMQELAGSMEGFVEELEEELPAVDYEAEKRKKAKKERLCAPSEDGHAHTVECTKHCADERITFLEIVPTSE